MTPCWPMESRVFPVSDEIEARLRPLQEVYLTPSCSKASARVRRMQASLSPMSALPNQVDGPVVSKVVPGPVHQHNMRTSPTTLRLVTGSPSLVNNLCVCSHCTRS